MTDDNSIEEINQLKKNIFSNNWETVKASGDRLGKIGGKDVTDFLISLLASDNPGIRNTAALALEDIKDNIALDPLLAAIFKKENHNYNGTMVFALQSLDCSKNLKDIFRILFYETHESKISAYAILCDQTFEFTTQDLTEIQQMWNDCNLHPTKCSGYTDERNKSNDAGCCQ
jgi:HEAT repeat protein